MDLFYQKGIYPSTYKIVAIGDLHGDWKATIEALKKGKIIDNKLNWIAGKTHLVQVGDILDRLPRVNTNFSDENSEFKIINLFLKLQRQAYKSGGAYHCIIGNHELMNIMGQFRFVSKKGFDDFKTVLNRKKFFKPGGKMCKIYAKTWNPIIKIGKYLFMHGGLSLNNSRKYNIPKINKIMRLYLKGHNNIFYSKSFQELFVNKDSILWNREFSMQTPNYLKAKMVVKNQNAEYMVLGHSPQNEGINLKNGIIWCIDTGMSEAFGKRNGNDRIQILQIIRNGKNVKIV